MVAGDAVTRVLIVDDADYIGDIISQVLDRDRKFITKVAYDGLEAIDVFMEFHPDLMFIDILMPELDGISSIKRIRAMGRDVKIIAISSFGKGMLEEQARAAGADLFLTKPLKMRLLPDIIDSVLGNVQEEGP